MPIIQIMEILSAKSYKQMRLRLIYRERTDIDKQAEEMFVLLVKELAENENVTEQLKAENQMLWMHQMNNIHNRVMEIINTDLIYV